MLLVIAEYKDNLLNTFFCSISEITTYFDKRTDHELYIFNITFVEIQSIRLNLKLGKTVGDDKISRNMLKDTIYTACKFLQIIV